ncbi:hypothetical protein MBELCI_3573 [Limimaricola cinnabarinus LL-001]|uniref:Uncharacterized protein n=1 Tax=Limimaricola cinnabarinus LL-001 TaxID=1337093 RepID=U2YQ34_9RHOB|nr:hypothetical protein MBELCI_3573 [Limimaricola cinnabarinus LL-001]
MALEGSSAWTLLDVLSGAKKYGTPDWSAAWQAAQLSK